MQFTDVQIAFAGHNRSSDIGDPERAQAQLRQAMQLLADSGVATAALVTGLAEGADRMAAQAWCELGLGPIHAVHPYLNEATVALDAPAVRSDTWLDGHSYEQAGRSPHLAQTRWLVESADLLVAYWSGEAARGPGGTADAVNLALDQGVTVLWIHPRDEGAFRLISPPDVDDEFSFGEFLAKIETGHDDITVPATTDRIATALASMGLGPTATLMDEPPEPARGVNQLLDALAHQTIWKTYSAFQKRMGGPRTPAEPTPPTPADLAEQPGFARLTQAFDRADQLSNRLSAVYRSQQILLLWAAVIATIIGTSPAVWPAFHLPAVAMELTLAFIALLVWSSSARAKRHERWSEARRLAEQLRLERAAWALGLTAINPSGEQIIGPAALRARAYRRSAGQAEGRFDADRVSRWGAWAIGEMVIAQATYHREQSVRSHHIGHRIHAFEDAVFLIFIGILATYVIGSLQSHLTGMELAEWVGGVLIMTSAIVPAIGAANLALEAQLGFSERGSKSRYLAERLHRIQRRLPANPRLFELHQAANAAIRLHNSEHDLWAENAARRPLIKGA